MPSDVQDSGPSSLYGADSHLARGAALSGYHEHMGMAAFQIAFSVSVEIHAVDHERRIRPSGSLGLLQRGTQYYRRVRYQHHECDKEPIRRPGKITGRLRYGGNGRRFTGLYRVGVDLAILALGRGIQVSKSLAVRRPSRRCGLPGPVILLSFSCRTRYRESKPNDPPGRTVRRSNYAHTPPPSRPPESADRWPTEGQKYPAAPALAAKPWSVPRPPAVRTASSLQKGR